MTRGLWPAWDGSATPGITAERRAYGDHSTLRSPQQIPDNFRGEFLTSPVLFVPLLQRVYGINVHFLGTDCCGLLGIWDLKYIPHFHRDPSYIS